ncbi:MAG: hypothetical protein SWE60_05645 [Thermodesulfobacteriota bacterium]|nr:hypothetical protein [Thermodesulfobacteriota bacterium]
MLDSPNHTVVGERPECGTSSGNRPRARAVGAMQRLQDRMFQWLHSSGLIYDTALSQPGNRAPFDLLLFSYSLSMINPGFQEVLQCAAADLSSQGMIAVVDFDDSRFAWFQRWMGVNQVPMDHQLIPIPTKTFTPVLCDVKPAYLGLWTFFYFLGQKG